MIPSDLNIRLNKIDFFNNKILVSKPGMKLGVNSSVNYTPPLQKEKKLPNYNVKQQQHEQHIQKKLPEQQHMKNDGKLTHHERLLAREHEDEKLALLFLIGGLGIWYFSR